MNEAKRKCVVDLSDLQYLFDSLNKRGYKVLGPTVSEEAIIYSEIKSISDLPVGVTDEHGAGRYRLQKRNDKALFGYAVGPHSWKKFLFPPHEKLWEAKYDRKGLHIKEERIEDVKYAFIGVRACELNAIKIQDKVFTGGEFVNPLYKQRRENAFIVALNCSVSGKNCFCVSMKAGPKVESGFDLSLTEILYGDKHYFLVEIGSKLGAKILKDVPTKPASENEINKADKIIENTSNSMGREMDTHNIKELFYKNYENSNWEEVAKKCLSCANCTMVCPTCFCSTVEDVTDLSGEHSERWQKWDSCFTLDFSHIHGGSVRSSVSSRYRQWITHKLATWIDQFGTSGCVGCGRCITWCPVGIDITEEVKEMQKSSEKAKEAHNANP